MVKLTKSQLSFLEEAIREAEIENVIGYPGINGQPSEQDKEIMELIEFLRRLRPEQILLKNTSK
jgi:hypothetical protein